MNLKRIVLKKKKKKQIEVRENQILTLGFNERIDANNWHDYFLRLRSNLEERMTEPKRFRFNVNNLKQNYFKKAPQKITLEEIKQ